MGVGSLLRKGLVKDKLNIITFPTHESQNTLLCKTGHNFFALEGPNIKKWETTYRPIPSNYSIYRQNLPCYYDYDLILCQNKHGQYTPSKHLSKMLHLPILNLTHTFPQNTTDVYLQKMKSMKCDMEVFISQHSRKAWGYKEDEAEVVTHGIDTNDFYRSQSDSKKHYILSVVNEFRQRGPALGYDFWQEVVKGLPHLHIGSTDDGWSKPAASVEHLRQEYNNCTVFIDTAGSSPIPMVLLEAMACGAVCVSRGNGMVPEVIQHGVNGFICKTPEAMRVQVTQILENPAGFQQIKANAVSTIKERFSLDQFVSDWDNLFRKAADIIYKE